MAGRIVALAGGVGGAKLAHGLQLALPDPRALAVIVNTGDDFELYGLHISPDLDTVMYTLSDLANPETGWGIRDETFATLHMIAQYGEEPWFQLGDRDFATHILRTAAMRAGTPLSEITGQMARNLDIVADLIPMTDDRVATLIDTPDGRLDFQEYFVARHHADAVHGIILDGIESATPTPAALRAIAEAEAIVFCPSNPFVSIGPILALAGLRAALDDAAAPVVVVSPIVGGEALKGPAATMMQGLGHEVSALGVARIYAGLADGVVIDSVDRELSDAIEALGMRVLITDTIMRNTNDREQLARETLAFAQSLTTTRSAR